MPPAPEPFQLLIADAVPALPEGTPLPDLPVPPQLDELLGRMQPAGQITVDDQGPATPFELALARAYQLPGEAGRIPWAAYESGVIGAPCAWLKPAHWQLGLDHVNLLDPAALALTEAESRALLASVQPLLAEDGLELTYLKPDTWLARGELMRGLTTWSMARALAQPLTRDVLAVAPTEAQSAHLRRLQTELQMLLYHHPVNEAREQARGWPVNALWIEGAGVLDAPPPPQPGVVADRRLAELPPGAGLEHWRAAWQAIATDSLARLRAALDAGVDARLTLCGPRRAQRLVRGQGLGFKISSLLKPQRWKDLRNTL